MFSKSCKYAVRATLFVASQSELNTPTNLQAIASAINSPEAFTAKILQTLVKNHIIESTKGRSGGFYMGDQKMNEINMVDIVNAFDGDEIYTGCILGLDACHDDKPCPVHNNYLIIRTELRGLLERTNIAKLSEGLKAGTTFLKL